MSARSPSPRQKNATSSATRGVCNTGNSRQVLCPAATLERFCSSSPFRCAWLAVKSVCSTMQMVIVMSTSWGNSLPVSTDTPIRAFARRSLPPSKMGCLFPRTMRPKRNSPARSVAASNQWSCYASPTRAPRPTSWRLATAAAFTRRERFLVFENAYHGSVLSFGSPPSPLNLPYQFEIARYNDIEGVRSLLRQSGHNLAAVLVEPMLGAGGCIPGDPEFLRDAGNRDDRRPAHCSFLTRSRLHVYHPVDGRSYSGSSRT